MKIDHFLKFIIFLYRERQKMTMEMEDLQNKMRDVSMMKVTREIRVVNNYVSILLIIINFCMCYQLLTTNVKLLETNHFIVDGLQ